MKKILYVEDNRDTAEAVQIILTNVGHDVDIAFNGKDGLRKISENTYDLILLDIMLPDMSGWDIFETARKKVKTNYAFLSAIPVSLERRKELKKAGVKEYITKPFEKADLIKRVNKMIK